MLPNADSSGTIAESLEARDEPRNRPLRLAASSPNIKAIFDATPASYPDSIPEQDGSSFYSPQTQAQVLPRFASSSRQLVRLF